MSMETIERLAKAYADARLTLGQRVEALEDEMRALRRRKLPGIKHALASAQDARDALQAELQRSPGLFERPRTRVLHGIKVGFRKAKGKLLMASRDQVLALIKRHLPDRADVLIRVKEEVNKAAVEQLDVAELKRIGCSIGATGDELVIAPQDSELDKMLDALMGDAERDAEQEEAA